MRTSYLFILFLFTTTIACFSQPNSERIKKDASFFGNGCITGTFSNSGQAYNCIAKQSDDKIIVAGYINSTFSKRWAIFSREFLNGKIDTTFGDHGSLVICVGEKAPLMTEINDIEIQNDGKIVAIGTCWNNNKHENMALIRITKDGDIDTTFAEFADSGYVELDYNKNIDQGDVVKIQPDGKYIIAGHSISSLKQSSEEINSSMINLAILARYHPTGKLDSSFGINGILHLDISPKCDIINDFIIEDDGKILVTGNCNFEDERDDIVSDSGNIFVIRLLQNGSYDKSFNTNGILIQDIDNEENIAKKIFKTDNNKILVLGMTKGTFCNGDSARNDLLFLQYNEDGSIDNSFGKNGFIVNNISSYDILTDAFITSEKKIVTIGLSIGKLEHLLAARIPKISKKVIKKYTKNNPDFLNKTIHESFTARFKQDGTLDSTLYYNGKIFSGFKELDRDFRLYSMLPLNDNDIIAVGMADNKFQSKFLVVKQIITLDAGELKCTKETNSITAYPNPVQQQTKVKYSICTDENVSLYLYDLQGKIIHTFFNNQPTEKGSHEVELNIPNEIPNGI
jgi:uncharacterized delta-60 repeat protein